MRKQLSCARHADQHVRSIADTIRHLARKYDPWRVWADFVHISAIALARLDLARARAREDVYRAVVRRYTGDELSSLVQAFGHLCVAFQACFAESATPGRSPRSIDFRDVLGELFMRLELGNAHRGQFFTPYEVSKLVASMSMSQVDEVIHSNGYVRVLEPACGAGGMLVACASALAERGLNYQRVMHATAIDIDSTCVHMTFVQCALLHIPAIVVHGNGISGEAWDHWLTPAHVIGGWHRRLSAVGNEDSPSLLPRTASPHR